MDNKSNNLVVGMSVFGAIFFIFGFATTFIITLTAPIKEIFGLSETAAQLVTSAFFITYPIMSIPAGKLIDRIGLIGTFVLATGVVMLQVAANPYVTALGPDSSASSRLNLTQALNSVATMVAPWLISVAIFKGLTFESAADNLEAASRVPLPFIVMGVFVIIVAIALSSIKLPVIKSEDTSAKKSVWKYPHVVLGAFAIFVYVGAEVGNAGLIVNYLRTSTGISSEMASTYAAIYWGGAMIGRFFGSFMFTDQKMSKKLTYVIPVLILAFISGSFVTDWNWTIGATFTGAAMVNFIIMLIGRGKAARTLAIFALAAAVLDITTTFSGGSIALWTIISIGLFNSIMFPNIFSLAVKDLDKAELSSASGLINALIIGGAIIPPLMGSIADNAGYTWAFIIPAVCYLYIFFYAVKGNTIRR
jgi:FHS family L-fucose permease-like MFS transporter